MRPFVIRVDPITIKIPLFFPLPGLPQPNWDSIKSIPLPAEQDVDLPDLAPNVELPNLDVELTTSQPSSPFKGSWSIPAPECSGACYVHAVQADSDSLAVQWAGFIDPTIEVLSLCRKGAVKEPIFFWLRT